MKKIAFVIPWFSAEIKGGAENELKDLAKRLNKKGLKIDILTTCIKEFHSDWTKNFYKEGIENLDGIQIKRFKVDKMKTKKFNDINMKLMNNIRINEEEEKIYIKNCVNSKKLYKYIEKSQEEYGIFIYIPYMFGTTYNGIKVCPEKSAIIPCFHDESYIYLEIYKEVFSKLSYIFYNCKSEYNLANKVFDLNKVNQNVLGIGINTKIEFSPERFRKKYNIKDSFILYAGRKDAGKKVDVLLKYFVNYKKENNNKLKLVLIGGGKIDIPHEIKESVMDLGFIPMEDKYNAFSAATSLWNPSENESFSLIIMESWLCERPVIVNEKCEVTKTFAIESNGGLYYNNYNEFEGCINYYLNNEDKAKQIGMQGKKYVLDNFDEEVVTNKYIEILKHNIL